MTTLLSEVGIMISILQIRKLSLRALNQLIQCKTNSGLYYFKTHALNQINTIGFITI